MKFSVLLKIFLFALALPLFAQQIEIKRMEPGQMPKGIKRSDDAIMADRARRMEERGEYEAALVLWQETLTRYPWHVQSIQGITRSMIVLKKFDEAEMFLNDLIEQSRFRQSAGVNDPVSEFSLSLSLGSVKRARGDEKAAWVIWNNALAKYENDPEAVRVMITNLQKERMWEDSERMIREYRKNTKNSGFMSLELASSLQAQMNFAGATTELILYAETSPSAWQVALSYMNRFPDDSTVVSKVTDEMNKALKRDRKNGMLWRLYAGYTLKAGMLEESLEATITADSLTGNGGMLVLQAAQSMLVEHDVELARRGFEQVLAWKPAPQVAEKAELGLALCYEALGEFTKAKENYEKFIATHARSEQIEEARFRAADIVLNAENNPLEALTLFKGIWIRGAGPMKIQAGLRVGDCHAQLKEFAPAIAAWTEVVTLSNKNQTEEGSLALMRIARANIWRDSLAAAIVVLDSIQAGNTLHTAFNDAVLYSALVSDGGAVRAFAEADYALFCGDNLTAAEKFKESADLLKYGRLAEWSRMQEAMSLREAGKPQEAIAVLDTFIAHFSESIELSHAKYVQIVIRMEDLHDESRALAEFQQFLIDHPRSLYLEQARRKARILQNRLS